MVDSPESSPGSDTDPRAGIVDPPKERVFVEIINPVVKVNLPSESTHG